MFTTKYLPLLVCSLPFGTGMYTEQADHQGTKPHFPENSRFPVQRYKRRIQIRMLHTQFSVSPVEFGIINSLLLTKIYCVGRVCKFDTASRLARNINQHKTKKKTEPSRNIQKVFKTRHIQIQGNRIT